MSNVRLSGEHLNCSRTRRFNRLRRLAKRMCFLATMMPTLEHS